MKVNVRYAVLLAFLAMAIGPNPKKLASGLPRAALVESTPKLGRALTHIDGDVFQVLDVGTD